MLKEKSTLHVKFEKTLSKYLQHLHSVFYNFVGMPPQVRYKRGGGCEASSPSKISAYSHPDLKFYDELSIKIKAYVGKKELLKILTAETPRALAHGFLALLSKRNNLRFMDDGHSDQNGRHRAYSFSTHSFPLSDQALLVQVLRDNFYIDLLFKSNFIIIDSVKIYEPFFIFYPPVD